MHVPRFRSPLYHRRRGERGTCGLAEARPLLVRFGTLGDLILCTPIMRCLSRLYSSPVDFVALGSWPQTVFQGLECAGRIVTVQSKNTPFLISPGQRRLVGWLKTSSHQPIYILEDDSRSIALIRRSGIRASSTLADFDIPVQEHVVDSHFRLAGLRASSVDRLPELRVSEEERKDAANWLASIGLYGHPLVLLQPGNKRTMVAKSVKQDPKYWPIERWAAVAKGVLRASSSARALVIGTSSEKAMTQRIVEMTGDSRCLSGAGHLPLRRLFAVISLAHSMISVDTGPAQAAAALSCPLVVLFGRTNPYRNQPISVSAPVRVVAGHPKGEFALTLGVDPNEFGIAFIEPDQVISAWTALTS